jgi:tRNA(Ile)-lysidine synthase
MTEASGTAMPDATDHDPEAGRPTVSLLDALLPRCRFPDRASAVTCAFSGGADSTALVALASHAGCDVTAVHIDHGLRASSGAEADQAAALARTLAVTFRAVRVSVEPGPNLEARARAARFAALPAGSLTGHTADDQAETVLINLIRGAGIAGLAGMSDGPTKPILALRRHETRSLCHALALPVIEDPSNADRRFLRNRIRTEVMPLLDDVAGRDVAALIARTARVVGDDAALLDELASVIDPTDARALATADPRLARRALRAWLTRDGYPPDLATVNRALDVANGTHRACEIGPGYRLERTNQRLEIRRLKNTGREPAPGQKSE